VPHRTRSLPAVRHGTSREFRERLHRLDGSLPGGLPLHDRELYLELHRGTLTTHAWLKQANRDGERDLRLAELLAFAGPGGLPADAHSVAERLTRAWRLLCLQQFHDILPGSSIAPVYEDARRDLAEIAVVTREITSEALNAEGTAGESGEEKSNAAPRGVVNPSSSTVSAVVSDAEKLRFVADLPPLSSAPLAATPPPPPVEIESEGGTATLRNETLEARIDERGRVAGLRSIRNGVRGPELAAEPLNRLALYRDIPMNWDAWDLDAYTERELLETNDTPARVLADHRTRSAPRGDRGHPHDRRRLEDHADHPPRRGFAPARHHHRRTTGMRPTATCGWRCRP
jgi:alpha-mannosidase